MALSVIAARVAATTGKAVVVWFDETVTRGDGAPWIGKEINEAIEFVKHGNKKATANVTNGVNGANGTNGVNGTAPSSSSSEVAAPAPAPLEPEQALEEAYASLPHFLHGRPFTVSGPSHPTSLLVVLSPSAPQLAQLTKHLPAHTGLLAITQYRPLSSDKLASLIPSSVERVLVLEPTPAPAGGKKRTTRWGPLYLDVVTAVAQLSRDVVARGGYLGRNLPENLKGQLEALFATLGVQNGGTAVQLGDDEEHPDEDAGPLSPGLKSPVLEAFPASISGQIKVPKHESAYSNMLDQLFGARLDLANAPSAVAPPTDPSLTKGTLIPRTNPEYALGATLARLERRSELKKLVRKALADGEVKGAQAEALSKWLEKGDKDAKVARAAEAAVDQSLGRIFDLRDSFVKQSTWIIGSEAWAHDLGASGLHHALACGEDVNLLLIDSEPYDPEALARDPERRNKKDAGLYAMNYGAAYVASVAVYGDYSQAARAMVEADGYNGPSIVVAYLPGGERDEASALEVLKETKRGIDAGYWPLYRWDPAKEKAGKEPFSLDSERIKADLKEFLDRQNHLTQLSARVPQYAPSIEGSYAKELKDKARARAKEAYEKLAGAISGPPLLILFASDGGNAEKVAKRLGQRARARGLGARVVTMDDFPFEDLRLEENVVLLTSTAGQGEFPQNGRAFWKYLVGIKTSAAGPDGGDGKCFDNVKFTVFAMGDSHYWPRPEDAHYYNKPGKDLDGRMKDLGAEELTALGLGDDQDADGYQTGYKEWEPRLWKAMGVEGVEVVEAESEPITNEHIKIASNFLRGTIKEGLADTTTGAIAESDGQLTKFQYVYPPRGLPLY